MSETNFCSLALSGGAVGVGLGVTAGAGVVAVAAVVPFGLLPTTAPTMPRTMTTATTDRTAVHTL